MLTFFFSLSFQACAAAFFSYFLVKLVPYWGLLIIGTTIAFFAPLVYATNQELIDSQIKNASEAINAQTAQVRDIAQKQADQITAMGKQYAGDYTGKVQDMLRGGRNGAAVPATSEKKAAVPSKAVPNFPTAPTSEPVKEVKEVKESVKETVEEVAAELPTAPKEEPLIAV